MSNSHKLENLFPSHVAFIMDETEGGQKKIPVIEGIKWDQKSSRK